VGLEPTAYRLTAECSTIELPWNILLLSQRQDLLYCIIPHTVKHIFKLFYIFLNLFFQLFYLRIRTVIPPFLPALLNLRLTDTQLQSDCRLTAVFQPLQRNNCTSSLIPIQTLLYCMEKLYGQTAWTNCVNSQPIRAAPFVRKSFYDSGDFIDLSINRNHLRLQYF
jgi:hypothetical protein